MPRLNLSTFIKTIKKCLKKHNKQASAGMFFLEFINNLEGNRIENYYSVDRFVISKIVNYKMDVPEGFRNAMADDIIRDEFIRNFAPKLRNDLNPINKINVLEELKKIIIFDDSIGEVQKKNLIRFYDEGDEVRFLEEVFLFSLFAKNTNEDDECKSEDFYMLAQANFECPICHKKLTTTNKGKTIANYRITHICPDNDNLRKLFFIPDNAIPLDFNESDNLIALCVDCSELYNKCPSFDGFKELRAIKEGLIREEKTSEEIDKLTIEEEINTILQSIMSIDNMVELDVLNYDALHIDDKIPDDRLLNNTIKNWVVNYYSYIRNVFSESGVDFDMIATQINLISMKLEKSGLSQRRVFDELSDIIRRNAGIDSENKLASEIVVSFFVQNCEVFHV